MLLITGCGRSGTHYTAEVLKKMGLQVGHETIERDGTVSWKHITTGSFVVPDKKRSQEIRFENFETVFQQVRHPLNVISSLQTFSESSFAYMAKFVDLPGRGEPLRRCMAAWLRWNELVEPHAQWRFAIEEFPSVFDELCIRLNLSRQTLPDVAPQKFSRRRRKTYRTVTWEDLHSADAEMAEKILAKAYEYGYEEDGIRRKSA